MRLGGIFDFENKQQRLEEVSQLLEDPKIWNDNEHSQKLGKERRELEDLVKLLVNIDNPFLTKFVNNSDCINF
jgi:peptide chain release factor 2